MTCDALNTYICNSNGTHINERTIKILVNEIEKLHPLIWAGSHHYYWLIKLMDKYVENDSLVANLESQILEASARGVIFNQFESELNHILQGVDTEIKRELKSLQQIKQQHRRGSVHAHSDYKWWAGLHKQYDWLKQSVTIGKRKRSREREEQHIITMKCLSEKLLHCYELYLKCLSDYCLEGLDEYPTSNDLLSHNTYKSALRELVKKKRYTPRFAPPPSPTLPSSSSSCLFCST
jgi:hypothetical protein